MLECILFWIYMFFINCAAGLGVLSLINRCLGHRQKQVGIMPALLAGVISITVYTEIFSIFDRIGMEAHLLLVFLSVLSAVCFWKNFRQSAQAIKNYLFSWEAALGLIFLLFTAYFASRGLQHTDTGIYHAQAIRWYEEYGLVKGLGNLQQHFAYNSAYLAYASIFSMKWLLGRSLHMTTGFMQVILCIWAICGLRHIGSHKSHAADGCRAAILIYALVNAEGTMSPATDYGTMYLSLWILTLWAQIACGERSCFQPADKESAPLSSASAPLPDSLESYSLLCVAAVCAATFKLSAGLLVLLVLYPAFWLLKTGNYKKIFLFIGLGLLVLFPFLARNYLLSGWLIYPFSAIDIFQVDWKIPKSYLDYDSAQIRVWGRCLYDVTKLEQPLSEWLPIWWKAKDRYEKMLLLANLPAVFLDLLWLFRCKITRQKISTPLLLLHLATAACIAGWFATAPFIRYGLAFLLAYPLMVFGTWCCQMPLNPTRIISGFAMASVFFSMGMYWDYYVLSDTVWIKHHLTDPSYLTQQDYDHVETGSFQLDTLTIYYPLNSDNISYHAFPATAYKQMGELAQMRGDTIKDGFRSK